ncbi:MAG: glycogen/starch/alpha-glucan family phosphorylase, partial [Clostridiales Family XIII bacterium]|nr:glycogen/starch/alpha-glucan family phosphorylase [Clostridiales Family XIII bacterium]
MFDNKEQFVSAYKRKFMSELSKTMGEATTEDKYVVLASMICEKINEKWGVTNNYYLRTGARQVYYFSLEFLLGKFLESNLIYLGAENVCREGLGELGIDLDELIRCEPDPALGNGGLGRLAACFLDSLASMSLPGHGNGIRYKYGLFRQQIVDGYQVELPDNWLNRRNQWEMRKADKAVLVKLNGHIRTEFDEDGNARFIHEDFLPVLAVPYDMPIMGYKNNTVNTLRLWSAESVDNSFDFASFSRGDYVNAVSGKYSVEAISEVLYPDDSNYTNRLLRLKQQYFFVSAGIQSIVRRFKLKQHDLEFLPARIAIHINDTHPALAVPELMRILIDEEGFGWEDAWDITSRTIAYTNHTIMPEALETWPVDLFWELLPRIYMIVEEINRRLLLDLNEKYPDDAAKVARMSVIGDGVVRMANLAVVGSFSVNGVAAVHTELLKNVVMKDFCDYYPEKFNN